MSIFKKKQDNHMKSSMNFPVKYLKYNQQQWEEVENGVIIEASLDLMVNGEFLVSLMCTPAQLEELAIGFLFNEGIIDSIDDIAIARVCDDKTNVDIWLTKEFTEPAKWRRTSGCSGGVTNAKNISELTSIPIQEKMDPNELSLLMEQLLESQELYREVRGVHCSILTDGHQVQAIAEDIGRHNTLDKIAGKMLMQNLPREKWIVLTTGRVSSEMLQKSIRMGAYMIVSRTSPSSLSIQLAQQLGITLVGYARRNQFNVYSHPERLV
jgi:FdhD protein